MTLFRQLFLILVALFLVMFFGTMLLNLYGTRLFLSEQLESHAQDTATSLGLSLSPYVKPVDVPAMETMINAIFDRGFYRDITIESIQKDTLVARKLPVTVNNVPDWFVRFVPLDTPRAHAQVMSGWQPEASVSVQIHPGFAYKELWQTARRMLVWFGSIAIIMMIAASILLRSILKPLAAVEHQAEALSTRRYYVQEKLPKARELKSVVLAMNKMTEKIHATFEDHATNAEQLREQAFKDSVTGLGNRRHFESVVQTYLGATQEPFSGSVMLLRLRGLDETNQGNGYATGDDYLCAASRIILKFTQNYHQAVPARMAGGDYALLLPGVDGETAERVAELICTRLGNLHTEGLAPSANVVNLGITEYTKGEALTDILAQADSALRGAQSLGPNAWSRYFSEATDSIAAGREQWKARLVEAMHSREFEFFLQPVVDTKDPTRILHAEILTRIPGPNDTLWRAGEFVTVAEKMGVARELDRIIVGSVLERIKSAAPAPAWAINLSATSLRDENFVNWLVTAISTADQRFVVEFIEFGAVREIDRLLNLAERLRASGNGVAIDHFGRGFSTFGYLQSLQPDYVKIDRAYTSAIGDDADNRFFVSALSRVAHSIDITTIAEAVENESDWNVLDELNVDGVQGYAVCRPMSIFEWSGTIPA
jgi:diguanylate cyclase (GGDEF)-like protein